jgi:uncharacterized protein YkwD
MAQDKNARFGESPTTPPRAQTNDSPSAARSLIALSTIPLSLVIVALTTSWLTSCLGPIEKTSPTRLSVVSESADADKRVPSGRGAGASETPPDVVQELGSKNGADSKAAGDDTGAVRGDRIDSKWITIFPPDKATDVPTTYEGMEIPDPIPDAMVKVAGFPITVEFAPTVAIREVAAELRRHGGQAVDIWLTWPGDQATRENQKYLRNTICIMSKQPLEKRAVYSVRVTAFVGNRPWEQAWSFSTRPENSKPVVLVAQNLSRQVINGRIRDKLNSYRKQAGLAPVRESSVISEACDLHARYLALNHGHPSTSGLGCHNEDSAFEGFTKEGQKAADRSLVISNCTDPQDAVDLFMNSLYHRLPLLYPSATTFGFGVARIADGCWMCVLVPWTDAWD